MILKLFLPSSNPTVNTDNFTVPVSVSAGTYNLVVTVYDNLNYMSPLQLAILGRTTNGSYVLRSNIVVS